MEYRKVLIFKENSSYRWSGLIKMLIIIFLVMLAVFYTVNIFLENQNKELLTAFEKRNKLSQKYKNLNKKVQAAQNTDSIYNTAEKTVFLAAQSRSLILDYLYLDSSQLIINAQAENEAAVFEFLRNLETEREIKNPQIDELSKRDSLYFDLSAEIMLQN